MKKHDTINDPIQSYANQHLVMGVINQLGLVDLINNELTWDKKQWKTEPGLIVAALIVSILHQRNPLYRLTDYFEQFDTEAIFGEGIKAENFNDDILGRVLDRISDVGVNKLFSAISLRVTLGEKIETSSFHADTTSINVWGEYLQVAKNGFKLAHGHSKDGHPELKQFLCGMIVNQEGIPLACDILSGNTSDKEWNEKTLKEIDHMITGYGNVPYIADSALVTKKNLKLIGQKQLSFISRSPSTFSVTENLKERAWDINTWHDLPTYSTAKHPTIYGYQEFVEQIDGYDYRFIVVKSSHLEARKEKTIAKRLKKEREELDKLAKELSKNEFACETDATATLASILEKNKKALHELTGNVESVIKRKRGRPGKNDVDLPLIYKINLSIQEPTVEKMTLIKAKAATFVLITNLLDNETWPAHAVLCEYKEQQTVERKFKILKDPKLLDAIFLKKPERIQALSMILVTAVLIYSIIERRVRRALKEANRGFDTSYRGVLTNPTGSVLLSLLTNRIYTIKFSENGVTKRYVSKPDKIAADIFQLANVEY